MGTESKNTRTLNNCILDCDGPLREEQWGEDHFVVGQGYCFYATNCNEQKQIYLLVKAWLEDEIEFVFTKCDRCGLDMLEFQENVMLGEDICCQRCAKLNPSEVLHTDAEEEAPDTEALIAAQMCLQNRMAQLISYCRTMLKGNAGVITHEELYHAVSDAFSLADHNNVMPVWLSRVVAGVMTDYQEGLEHIL